MHTIFKINTHHVQDDKNSGRGVAPQEDSQSDADIKRFLFTTGESISLGNYGTMIEQMWNLTWNGQ